MNLILTDKCTNSCPYCFAAAEMSKDSKKNDLSRKDFDRFMDFLSSSGEHVDLNVIGGEPLVYPDLDYVMNRLYHSDSITEIFLMTGGIVDGGKFEQLLPYRSKMRMMFNVNEKVSYKNHSHQELVYRNIDYAISLGYRVCIGFNIYHHDFNGEEILELCMRNGIRHLRFAVACPIYGEKGKQFIVPAIEYGRLATQVFDFLVDCYESGIEAVLDCPVPFCFFSE